jgi:hypothetical protein
MYCIYNDILFVVSGVGTMGMRMTDGGANHTKFIGGTLSKHAHVPWKFCIWHKTQSLLQTGDKKDEVGYAVYETCRAHGAIVFTSHEHSYERTHLLSSFENQTIVSKSNTMYIKPGHSFAVVSGLGGESIRPWYSDLHFNPCILV